MMTKTENWKWERETGSDGPLRPSSDCLHEDENNDVKQTVAFLSTWSKQNLPPTLEGQQSHSWPIWRLRQTVYLFILASAMVSKNSGSGILYNWTIIWYIYIYIKYYNINIIAPMFYQSLYEIKLTLSFDCLYNGFLTALDIGSAVACS